MYVISMWCLLQYERIRHDWNKKNEVGKIGQSFRKRSFELWKLSIVHKFMLLELGRCACVNATNDFSHFQLILIRTADFGIHVESFEYFLLKKNQKRIEKYSLTQLDIQTVTAWPSIFIWHEKYVQNFNRQNQKCAQKLFSSSCVNSEKSVHVGQSVCWIVCLRVFSTF